MLLILPLLRTLLVVSRRSLLVWRAHHFRLGVSRLLRLLLPILRRNRLARACARRSLLTHHSFIGSVVSRRWTRVVLRRPLRMLLLRSRLHWV